MKRALAAIGVLAALVLVAPPAQAQLAGVRGKVVDEEGKGVADAKIHFEFVNKPVTYDTQADSKGEYLQLGMELGIYRITATREGYVGSVIDIRVNGMIDAPKIELVVAPPTAAELTEMFNEAVRFAQAGQLDEAEATFKELLELQPGLAEVHGNLGYVYAQKKDWASAEASYLEALELNPGDPASTLALSQVYRDSGQGEKAQELLDQMASERPDDAAAQVKRGVFLLNSGKSEEAQAAFEAALAADPAQGEAHYHLGTILVGQGKVPEAIGHLEAYLASNPANAQAAETAQGLIDALKK